MVSYSQTPLFPIQEATNSTSSLPASSNHANLAIVAENNEENDVYTILNNYRRSEKDYLVELKTLYSIVKSFDPVYNNYYDDSMEDITDEMVEERKEKNDSFKELVSSLILKHKEVSELLKLPKLDAILLNLVTWSDGMVEMYTKYIEFYKLDVSQCKTEIKIRRRPLIRIRYLSDFFKSLKEAIILMGEKPYTAFVLSSFEVLTFKLTKCLNYSKKTDDLEKHKCGNELYTTNAKDVIKLTPVLADVRQSQLDQEYFCDLHYINQTTTLEFLNITVVTLKNTPIDQIAILQRDTFGKHLLFSPLRKNEFTVKVKNGMMGTSLEFQHTILKDQLKICFLFNKNTNPELSSVLLRLFPKYVPSAAYNIPKFGLGIRMGKDENEITKNSPQKSNQLDVEKPSQQYKTHMTIIDVQKEKENDIESTEVKNNTKNNNNNNNTPLYHKFLPNDISHGSQCNFKQTYNLIDAPEQLKKESDLSRKLLIQVATGDVSDEESDVDEVQSVVSSDCDHDSAIGLKNRLSTLSNELKTLNKSVEPVSANKTTKAINLDKYQNSLQSNDKSKRKSIFGALSGLLSRKQNKPQHKVNSNSNNIIKSKISDSNISLRSMSSIVSSNNDMNLQNVLKQAQHQVLPSAEVSLWNVSSWTKNKTLNLSLFNICENKFYVGFYENHHENPLLLLELDQSTDCIFNTIDIHLKARNLKGNEITVMIKPLDRRDMKVIGNALVNPELFETIVKNSSSVSSDLSTVTQLSRESVATSMTVITDKGNDHDVQIETDTGKKTKFNGWSGVGDLKLIMSSKRLVDLNRCVVVVERNGNDIMFDLTGFEFGNIEVKVDPKCIRIDENNGVYINGGVKGVYLLVLDSSKDVESFESGIF